MYRIFFYALDNDGGVFGTDIFIESEEEYKTFDEVMCRCASIGNNVLFEVAKDVPWFDGSCNVTCLKTVFRPAAMREFVNRYYFRW